MSAESLKRILVAVAAAAGVITVSASQASESTRWVQPRWRLLSRASPSPLGLQLRLRVTRLSSLRPPLWHSARSCGPQQAACPG